MVSTRSSSVRVPASPAPGIDAADAPPSSTRLSRKSGRPSSRAAAAAGPWSHSPTPLTLLWLAVSLPLVAWDMSYVLLRPWTMPGGHLHWPVFAPYALYGEVDQVYGWKAFHARNGFTAAQSWLNMVETALYLAYARLYFSSCERDAAGARGPVAGRKGALALLLGFSAAVMTCSKTLLYLLNEACSGFDHIGHNPWFELVFLWILPNGPWLIVSAYMVYVMGSDILDGLTIASAEKPDKSE